MDTVVGVFNSRNDAEHAVTRLRAAAMSDARINVLIPGESVVHQPEIAMETEQPGVGKAVGGVIGGAAGAFAGLSIAASLMLPGVGLVTAVGLAAAAMMTVAGAIGGGAVGGALDDEPEGRLPVDELYVYEDALRKGRSVVFVQTEDDEEKDLVQRLLAQAGAESIDAAREQWWVGLRDAAAARYPADGSSRDDAREGGIFRRGFEVAQLPAARGKTYDEARDYLRTRYPEDFEEDRFRAGYESGFAYRQRLRGS
jgi:hypothetical protein